MTTAYYKCAGIPDTKEYFGCNDKCIFIAPNYSEGCSRPGYCPCGAKVEWILEDVKDE